MRQLILALVFAATAAVAQDDSALRTQFELEMQLTQARQRDIDLRNQLTALETRQRAEAALQALESAWKPAGNPQMTGQVYAELPDDRLAESNARVRAALQTPARR